MKIAPIVIHGAPCDKWADVQAIQHLPFIYIMSNGSRWAGEEPDTVANLCEVLKTEPLDVRMFKSGFYSTGPLCDAKANPAWSYQSAGGVARWLDGERLYRADGVVRFFGNFANLSHVFNIDTNHAPTIAALRELIDANVARQPVAA